MEKTKRSQVQARKNVPQMQSLYDWIKLQSKTLSDHAEMANLFDYIRKFCRNGWVEIDDNIGENAFRRVASGRKSYLFMMEGMQQ